MYRCVLTFAAGALLAVSAHAQLAVQRGFPAQALRGTFAIVAAPEVVLNGQPARLAPGARVRDTNNLIVQSSALGNTRLVVNYTRDLDGLVREVWLLRPEEAARPWPTTPQEAASLVFDPAAQTWARP
ncbi:MAG: hypothetical protein IPG93_15735 [Burkholderiales bacterium]|nr:hypothetical protein [Burkholderiales bacterium]